MNLFERASLFVSCQTVTEKHKLNVPETMTEVLDVSDEEGELVCLCWLTMLSLSLHFIHSFIQSFTFDWLFIDESDKGRCASVGMVVCQWDLMELCVIPVELRFKPEDDVLSDDSMDLEGT